MSQSTIRTGELARRAGVNRETIRFYERHGLLPPPRRSPAGYRLFSTEDVERILFIKNAQQLGFSLAEVKELLAVADGRITRCSEVRAIAESRLTVIEEQLARLTRLKAVLTDLVARCARARSISDCPIIHSLVSEGKP